MKNISLISFALLILIGWTALAMGVIAAFAGAPEVSTRSHRHPLPPWVPPDPLISGRPCPATGTQTSDASVPCEV